MYNFSRKIPKTYLIMSEWEREWSCNDNYCKKNKNKNKETHTQTHIENDAIWAKEKSQQMPEQISWNEHCVNNSPNVTQFEFIFPINIRNLNGDLHNFANEQPILFVQFTRWKIAAIALIVAWQTLNAHHIAG